MKKMSTRLLSLLLLVCLLLGLLAGCSVEKGGDGDKDNSQQGGSADRSVTIAMTGDVNTWNPWYYNEIVANSIQRHVFDSLVDVDNDLQLIPSLATEWSTSDGGATWDFTLREGVTFSNGSPFTADDVIYSFERCIALAKGWADATATIAEVQKVDDYHVKFVTTGVDAILPASVKNIMILDKETTENLDDAALDDPANVVGTSRYKLVEYIRDDHTTLALNESYWGEAPEAETVIFRSIPNDGTRTASLMGQEVDMITNVPVTDVATLEGQDFLHVVSMPSIGVMFYNMAQTEGDPSKDSEYPLVSPDGSNPLRLRDVRLAMAMAINVDELIEQVMNGYAIPAPTCVPEGFNGYNPNIEPYPYDPEGAEELLDDAGYPRQDDGYRFEITIDCTNDRYINDAATATAIAAYLDKVGIKCNVNAMSRSVFFNYISVNDDLDTSHFYQSGWSELSGESVLLARDLVYGNTIDGRVKENYGGANRGFYNNPEVNALIDEAMATSDYDARDAIMQEVWQIIYDDVAIYTTYFTSDVYATNTRVEYTPRSDQMIYAWNFSFPA